MNMDMYNQVKGALRSGKSLDDIMNEFSAMAAAAEQELKPGTPIADHCLYAQTICDAMDAIDDNGCKNVNPIATLVAAWLVENGVTPDDVFDSYGEFIGKVKDQLDHNLSAFKTACEVAKVQKNGASDSQLIGMVFKYLGDQLKDTLN